MNPISIIAVMLTSAIWIVVVSSTIAAIIRPPGSVTDDFRESIFDVLQVILGLIGGFMLKAGKSTKEDNKTSDDQEPKDKP